MIIKPIKIADIDIVAQVAAECFADDHFYASLHSDREQRKELLKKLFIESSIFVSFMDMLIFMNQKENA